MALTERVSVAMCTYNGARFLADQLASIASQHRLPDEIVVCDDGSTDGTIDVLDEFKRRAPFPLRLIVNERNLGSTKNFEQALRLCEGDIVFLSDQDDVWLPEKTQRVLEAFAGASDIGAVFTDAEIVDEELRPAGYGLWDAIRFPLRERDAMRSGFAAHVLLKHNVVTGATMALRRRYLDLVAPIPGNWIHDGWIALLISAVARLEPIEERLVRYRQHARNQVGARREDLAGRVAAAKRVRRSAYLSVAQQYEIALDRLRSLPASELRRDLISRTQSKIRHQARRGRMPSNAMLRAVWVLRELVQGRYHEYSGGYRSALKDIAAL